MAVVRREHVRDFVVGPDARLIVQGRPQLVSFCKPVP